MPREAKYDKTNPEPYLGAAIIAYHEALRASVEALAELNGTNDLTWFDELRQNTIRAAKGTVTDQIPVEVEADALRFSIQVLENEFDSIRVGLLEPKQS